jgi:hypothetical protein
LHERIEGCMEACMEDKLCHVEVGVLHAGGLRGGCLSA